MTSQQTASQQPAPTREHTDLLATLAQHRYFLTYTVRDLDDEQIRRRTTVSQLTLGGLIKHVSADENSWASFIVDGPSAFGNFDEAAIEEHLGGFRVDDGETLAGLLEHYRAACARTDDVLRHADLDASHPLPSAPWFEPGSRWSARRVALHIIAETAQHAGHADIIREALDGAKTMG